MSENYKEKIKRLKEENENLKSLIKMLEEDLFKARFGFEGRKVDEDG